MKKSTVPNNETILSFVENIKKHVDKEIHSVQAMAAKSYSEALQRIEERVTAPLSEFFPSPEEEEDDANKDTTFFTAGNKLLQKSMESLHDRLEESRRLTTEALTDLLHQPKEPDK